MGFDDIVVDEKDIFYERELLCNLSLEEIVNHPYFCNDSWNRAASKKYTFLLATTTFPRFFDDISEEKMLVAANTKNNGQKKYMESVMNDAISWTIFVLPNNIWAKNIFPNTANSCKKLERIIYSMCMINGNKSIENWEHYIAIENKKVEYLNKLNIKELSIKNNLGTNITIRLPKDYIFRSLENNHCIENMPTYSVWTAPHKYFCEGIVYGSMPITYRQNNIDEYWFKFSDGKVVDYDAKKGKECLDDFFSKGDKYRRLGEVAIIDYNLPVSETKLIFHNNLLDENSATHLAFGCAYQNTIKNGPNMTEKELDEIGCNICSEHMDFTIGTKDLQIIAKTYDDKEYEIFKRGNFNYSLINERSPFSKG